MEGNLAGVDDTTAVGPSIRSAVILPHRDGTTEYRLGTSIGIYSTRALAGAATVWTEEGAEVTGKAIVTGVRARVSDGLVAAATHGRGLFVREVGPTVYESADPARVVDPSSAVGTATASPFELAPAAAARLFYQVDDGTGAPARIRLVRGGPGLRIYFP